MRVERKRVHLVALLLLGWRRNMDFGLLCSRGTGKGIHTGRAIMFSWTRGVASRQSSKGTRV